MKNPNKRNVLTSTGPANRTLKKKKAVENNFKKCWHNMYSVP